MKKRCAALVALAMIAGVVAIPAPDASAATVGVIRCHTRFPQWPSSSGSATCRGTFTGATSSPTRVCVPSCLFDADLSYATPCPVTAAPLPPVSWSARGRYRIDGIDSGEIQWWAVGAVVVMVPEGAGTTSGVAAFVPSPPIQTIGQCPPGFTLPFDADIAGAIDL